MKSLTRGYRAAVALIVGGLLLGTAMIVADRANGQAGAQRVQSIQGGDVFAITRGSSPLNNVATANQIATFINAGDSTPRNVLLGGDFTTNPFQLGTSQAADISNTITTGPDGWRFLGGASSAINWSQQTAAADTPTGFGASLRFQRKSGNADTAAICVTQVLESGVARRFAGQTAVFSFYALKGANYSSAANALQATIAYGTGTNQSAANFLAGSWTNQANAVQSNVTVTATWTQFQVAGAIPVQTASTNVNQVGVKLCFTPVGTAGANDWFELAGLQLEVVPTGGGASPFDYHLAATELNVSQRSLVVINEPASGIGIGVGVSDTTTTCLVTVALPDTMRAAPTVSFGGTALGGSTWQVRANAGNRALSTPFLAANTGHSLTNFNLTATTGATQVAGQACVLQGAGGGAKVIVSSEL